MITKTQHLKRGAFILFEGIDRCGKTTQSKELVNTLNKQGVSAELLRFPERTTPVGVIIDNFLKRTIELNDHTIHLLYATNRWESKEKIENLLNQGKTIVMDRYAYSGIAFSAAKGLSLKWCLQADKGLPAPDIILFLDISVEEAMKRKDFGQERFEIKSFQEKVLENYKNLQRLAQNDIKSESLWKVLDARKSPEQLAQEIEKIALAKIKECGDKPIEIMDFREFENI